MEYSQDALMTMEDLCELLSAHFEEVSKDANYLFEVDLDKEKLWKIYLYSFPPEANGIYRQRRIHDCTECKTFIRNFGNVVVIKDNKVHTIWDFHTGDEIYQPVMRALDACLLYTSPSPRD